MSDAIEKELITAIMTAATDLIQTYDSNLSTNAIRTRMERIANDLLDAANETKETNNMKQSAKVEIEGNKVKISIPSQWHSERGAMIMDRGVGKISFDVREMTMPDRIKLAKVLYTI